MTKKEIYDDVYCENCGYKNSDANLFFDRYENGKYIFNGKNCINCGEELEEEYNEKDLGEK